MAQISVNCIRRRFSGRACCRLGILSLLALVMLLLGGTVYYFQVYLPLVIFTAIPPPPPLDDPSLLINDTLARELSQKVRLFCWANSVQNRLTTSLKAINDTWIRRCDDHLFFVESKKKLSHDIVTLGVQDGRGHLTTKSTLAWKYVYRHKLDAFDWFLQGDEDTYVIVENLMLLLSRYNASQPIWLGFTFKHEIEEGFMSGGASYVLSHEAVRRLNEDAYQKQLGDCPQTGGAWDDLNLGLCMRALGIPLANTLDHKGRHTFHTHSMHNYMSGDTWKKTGGGWFPQVIGSNCCSQLSISFHYVTPDEIRMLDYLLYRITVYGRVPLMDQLQFLIQPATLPNIHTASQVP